MEINARQAVESAVNYLDEMRDLIASDIQDIGLEEIERSETEEVWLVTLGYNVPYKVSYNPLLGSQNLMAGKTAYSRSYKMFHVNAVNGDVQSMKVRTFQ